MITEVSSSGINIEVKTFGANGKSAYDIAVIYGFVGTEEEWLESLTGSSSGDVNQEDCLDNATEQIVIGSATTYEKYDIEYVITLNVSGKKISGSAMFAYDADEDDVIFDDERSYTGTDILGIELTANINSGNIRMAVELDAVGENAKIRFTTRKISQIV